MRRGGREDISGQTGFGKSRGCVRHIGLCGTFQANSVPQKVRRNFPTTINHDQPRLGTIHLDYSGAPMFQIAFRGFKMSKNRPANVRAACFIEHYFCNRGQASHGDVNWRTKYAGVPGVRRSCAAFLEPSSEAPEDRRTPKRWRARRSPVRSAAVPCSESSDAGTASLQANAGSQTNAEFRSPTGDRLSLPRRRVSCMNSDSFLWGLAWFILTALLVTS